MSTVVFGHVAEGMGVTGNRLTNAHSKSPKHHVAMRAIFFAWYNFWRKHETIKQTPAMVAGLADKVWTIQKMLEMAAK